MPHKSPEVVFFDAAGTLIRLLDSVGSHYSRIAARHGMAVRPETLDAAFRRAWKGSPSRRPLGRSRPDDDRAWWRVLVERVFVEAGADPASFDFETCFAEMYDHFARPGVWALFPEAEETLRRLSADFRLAVISNFDARLHRVLADLRVAEYFERVTVSSEVGADKPHPEIYEAALAAMKVSAGDALHVGDDPDLDWLAAETMGMQVFRLDRPRNSLRDLLP